MDMSIRSGTQPLLQDDAGRGIFCFSPRIYSIAHGSTPDTRARCRKHATS
jgi:hypothetical protein